MEIRVLQYFLAVVREESITRAADALHITQPTLSRQMAGLEEETGVKLFERGSRKIALTNEGHLLKRRAEEILRLVDKTQQELVEQEEQVEGKITIGCGELASVRYITDVIEKFRKQYPRVTYDIVTAPADIVKDQIEKGLIDVGLLLEPISVEKFEYKRLPVKERWVVIMKSDNKLAEKEKITAEDLAKVPLILPRRINVQSELASWFGEFYTKLNVQFTSNLNSNGAMMVDQGLGYFVCIESYLPFLNQHELTYRPLTPELTATSVLAWKRNEPSSVAVTKFIQCFQGMD
ncbi:MAG: LysR family transcriptional regulator [Lachnospiraceae bacterium]|nr:LysR family transcriptional regulator [Lachnospiraceae bacterium]MDD3617100.1 LysR family transcriptional regulator [Lachnospiraceae bacterium]